MLGVETATVWIYAGMTLFTCGIMEVVGQRFIFDESRAVYICVARYNEYVNFRMKCHFVLFILLSFNSVYVTTKLCFRSVIDRFRSFTLGQSARI